MVGISVKTITLCADDFGLSPGISEGIIHLINRDRINATTCMVNSTYWNEHASTLKSLVHKTQIGLHFSLTDVDPAIAPRYEHIDLIKNAYLRNLDRQTIEKEWFLQIEKFEKAMGKLPDFIDGHQHIHQLPIIREALISVYKKIFPKKNCWIRIPVMKPITLKSYIIAKTGSKALKKALLQEFIPFNISFSGIYSFSKARDYPHFCQQFLKNIEHEGLIMCHPGITNNKGDVMALARQREFHYFNSDAFLKDCQKYSVALKPFNLLLRDKTP